MGEIIFSLAERRAAKVAALTPAKRPARLMRLEVMHPAQPGGVHDARLIDAYVDPALDGPGNLIAYAQALEEIATRFRAAAQRDAC